MLLGLLVEYIVNHIVFSATLPSSIFFEILPFTNYVLLRTSHCENFTLKLRKLY